MQKLKQFFTKLKSSEVVRYGLIGGLTQVLDIGLFSLLVCLGVGHILANNLVIPVVVTANYFGHKLVTFKVKKYSGQEIIRYVINLLFLAVYSSLLLYLFIDLGHLPEIVGKILQVAVITVSNFLILKRLVFAKVAD